MSATTTNGAGARGQTAQNIVRILLEGRAFFALIAIVIAFSSLSPNYASVGNFLIMANHVAIFGLLAIGMLLVILKCLSFIDFDDLGGIGGTVRASTQL